MAQASPPHRHEPDGTLRYARALALRGVPFGQAVALARRRRPRSFSARYADEVRQALPARNAFAVGIFMARGGPASGLDRPAVVRRMPAARPAARRPRTGTSRVSTRGSPDDDAGEPEPPPSAALTFENFHGLTPGCSGRARLSRFYALPAEWQRAMWSDLAAQVDAERTA